MIFVDSSVWINYFNGVGTPEVEHLDGLLGTRRVAIGDLVLLEVLQGFRRRKDYDTAKELLLSLKLFDLLGQKMALKSAQNYRILRSKGITIRKTADVVIATFCIENNLSLLHADRDFEPFVEHLGLSDALPRTIG